MTLKLRLVLLVLFVVLTISMMLGLLYYSVGETGKLAQAQQTVSGLETRMLLLRRHEKDFLSRDQLKYRDRFVGVQDEFQVQLNGLNSQLQELGIKTGSIPQLRAVIQQYTDSFLQIVALKQQIGLTSTEGLRGTLRAAVHGAEKGVKSLNNDSALAAILQLRRNEKDFLLRKDLKYRKRFQDNFARLIQLIEGNALGAVAYGEVIQGLNQYQMDFLKLLSTYEQLGLTSETGLMGEMRSTIHKSEALLSQKAELLATEIAEHKQATLTFATIIAGILTLVLVFVSTLLARSIIRPVNDFRNLMNRAREERDLSLRYQGTGKDEFALIGGSFNMMMDEFGRLLREVNQSSLDLSAAAEEVSVIAVENAKGLDHQRHEVVQVSSSIGEMEKAMQEISTNTELTAQTARSSQDIATQSENTINKAIEQIRQLAAEATSTSEAIKLLEQRSENISTVLDVIKEIAEQTNLLALNASIEAARAGEHGRGFAVVADEVRGLAARTQTSAHEIEQMIADLQSRTGDVARVMHSNIESSHQSADGASASVESLDQIVMGASQIVDMTVQVASAIEEQTCVAGEIRENAGRIQDIVEQASEHVDHNAKASEEVAVQAVKLQQAVERFKL